MNAFHPATIGALYGVLATHEQALAQWALAAQLTQADVDGETADRYAAVVSDVKRLIALAEPAESTRTSGIEHTEMLRRAHTLLGQLISQLSDFDVWSWEYNRWCGISGTLHVPDGGDPRQSVHEIAERLGLPFTERLHGSGSTICVEAAGEIDGITVRIYDLIEAERPICDTHHLMVDAAGMCPECPVEDSDKDLLAELRLVHVPEQHGDDQVCGFCSERQEAPVLWPCSDLRTAEAELGGADYEADDDRTHEGRFTDAQLDGTACSECGGDFAEGAATVPTGLVIDGGQLFAHPDCPTDNTATEPPGDAP